MEVIETFETVPAAATRVDWDAFTEQFEEDSAAVAELKCARRAQGRRAKAMNARNYGREAPTSAADRTRQPRETYGARDAWADIPALVDSYIRSTGDLRGLGIAAQAQAQAQDPRLRQRQNLGERAPESRGDVWDGVYSAAPATYTFMSKLLKFLDFETLTALKLTTSESYESLGGSRNIGECMKKMCTTVYTTTNQYCFFARIKAEHWISNIRRTTTVLYWRQFAPLLGHVPFDGARVIARAGDHAQDVVFQRRWAVARLMLSFADADVYSVLAHPRYERGQAGSKSMAIVHMASGVLQYYRDDHVTRLVFVSTVCVDGFDAEYTYIPATAPPAYPGGNPQHFVFSLSKIQRGEEFSLIPIQYFEPAPLLAHIAEETPQPYYTDAAGHFVDLLFMGSGRFSPKRIWKDAAVTAVYVYDFIAFAS